MKIGFVFTNYNNSCFTREAIRSLSLNCAWNECYIVIVDNNSDENDIKLLKELQKEYQCIHLILNHENLGYFKGLNVGIDFLRGNKHKIDYIVIGNNDLFFPDDFVGAIHKNINLFEKYSVISPNIITMDGAHQNPHVIEKVGKFREFIYDLYYLNYRLAILIKKIAVLTSHYTERKDTQQYDIPQTIYSGHGSCYILGPLFFNHFDSLWAPTFLMGEEFFLTKQLETKNLKIYYEPSIVVNHHYHATMDKIPSMKAWKISRESHRIYRKYLK
jgi:GT2 family glycosyltransferase